MKGNDLKRRFLFIWGFLGHILVEKISVKNWPKVKLTPYKNGYFSAIFFRLKNVSKFLKMKGNDLKRPFLLI